MTGREIVDLIEKLKEKGLNDTEIIEIIIYVEFVVVIDCISRFVLSYRQKKVAAQPNKLSGYYCYF